jgi:ribosomal peptide maturation radical SAM protein 1
LEKYKVLLINMPFATTKWPSLGISILKPQLTKRNIECDIRYFNFDFASIVGVDLYEKVSLYSPNLLGERVFAKEKFGNALPSDKEYIKTCGLDHIRDESFLNQALTMSTFVATYLDSCAELIHSIDYNCVAFTNMFEQTVASVSLADRLKALDPHLKIIMGGANCDGEMGVGLSECFHSIDIICRGEADETFPAVIENLAANKSLESIPGVVYRDNNDKLQVNDSVAVIENLDELPFPDYSDYFSQLRNYAELRDSCQDVHMQCSRGCWWGARSACKFCGLNRSTIKYRSKTQSYALEELNYINKTYVQPNKMNMISMTDNVLDMGYFDHFIPSLIKDRSSLNIFFEVKSNLTGQQLYQLGQAGIRWVQPGIENLCTDILKIMSKGVTGINNVRFLKQCMVEQIYATWNLLYGFPYEKEEHYEALYQTIPKIVHLIPPEGFTPLSLQRFSEYSNNPEKYGIINVKPENSYFFVFPFDEKVLSKIAYFFDYTYSQEAKPFNGVQALSDYLQFWTDCFNKGQQLISVCEDSDMLVLYDTRSTAISSTLILLGLEKDIYEYCYDVRNFRDIIGHLRNTNSNVHLDDSKIRSFLDELVERNVMLKEGDKYLGLAIPEIKNQLKEDSGRSRKLDRKMGAYPQV